MELGFFCGAMEEMCVDVDNIEHREKRVWVVQWNEAPPHWSVYNIVTST